MSSSNYENVSTVNNMFDFYIKILQNIQIVTFNFIDNHSSLELLLFLALFATCLISWFDDWIECNIVSLDVPSKNIKNKV